MARTFKLGILLVLVIWFIHSCCGSILGDDDKSYSKWNYECDNGFLYKQHNTTYWVYMWNNTLMPLIYGHNTSVVNSVTGRLVKCR